MRNGEDSVAKAPVLPSTGSSDGAIARVSVRALAQQFSNCSLSDGEVPAATTSASLFRRRRGTASSVRTASAAADVAKVSSTDGVYAEVQRTYAADFDEEDPFGFGFGVDFAG